MKLSVTPTDHHPVEGHANQHDDHGESFTGRTLTVNAEGCWVNGVQVIKRDRRRKYDRLVGHPWLTRTHPTREWGINWTGFTIGAEPNAPYRPTEDGIPGVIEETLEGRDVKPCTKCYLHPEGHAVEHPWRAEVVVGGEHRWATNALTFASESDAKAYALDLTMRWTSVVDFRAVPVTTPEHEEYVKP